MVKKHSYPRKEAPPPIKKKARQTSDEDGAPKDKATGRGLQTKMENGPLKGLETSEIVWAHCNSKTTTLFTSAVHPLNDLSIEGPARSTK